MLDAICGSQHVDVLPKNLRSVRSCVRRGTLEMSHPNKMDHFSTTTVVPRQP